MPSVGKIWLYSTLVLQFFLNYLKKVLAAQKPVQEYILHHTI